MAERTCERCEDQPAAVRLGWISKERVDRDWTWKEGEPLCWACAAVETYVVSRSPRVRLRVRAA